MLGVKMGLCQSSDLNGCVGILKCTHIVAYSIYFEYLFETDVSECKVLAGYFGKLLIVCSLPHNLYLFIYLQLHFKLL